MNTATSYTGTFPDSTPCTTDPVGSNFLRSLETMEESAVVHLLNIESSEELARLLALASTENRHRLHRLIRSVIASRA